jgi:hypothetical protein
MKQSILWTVLVVLGCSGGAQAVPGSAIDRNLRAESTAESTAPAVNSPTPSEPTAEKSPEKSPEQRPDAVVLATQTLSFPRGGANREDLPKSLQTATVAYPLVQSLGNRRISSDAGLQTLQNTLSLKQILGKSAAELQAEAQDYSWMTRISYRVNYNRHFLLDLTVTEEGMGAYPDAFERHRVVDLRSGRALRAADVFDRDQMTALVALVNQAMEAEKQAKIAEVTSADKGENEAAGIVQQLQEHRFRLKHLNDFMVDDRGVTFRYEYGFPHVIKAAQPDGRYFFSYADLRPFMRPDGALAQFMPASPK